MKKIVSKDGVVLLDSDAMIYLNLYERCPSDLGLPDIDEVLCDYNKDCEMCMNEAFNKVKEVELKLILEDDESASFTGRIESEPYEDDYAETITTDAIEDMFVYITKTYSREDIDYLATLLNSYIYKSRKE